MLHKNKTANLSTEADNAWTILRSAGGLHVDTCNKHRISVDGAPKIGTRGNPDFTN